MTGLSFPVRQLSRINTMHKSSTLCYISRPLISGQQLTAVDIYDKLILKTTYTVELVITSRSGDTFVAAFHQMRQQRRKVKDLSICWTPLTKTSTRRCY
ncbi:MAG: hypothetical protein ACLSH6_08475 [Limosilactobacillus pontis]